MHIDAPSLILDVLDRGLCVDYDAYTSIAVSDFSMELNEEGKFEAKRKDYINITKDKNYLRLRPFPNEALNELYHLSFLNSLFIKNLFRLQDAKNISYRKEHFF